MQTVDDARNGKIKKGSLFTQIFLKANHIIRFIAHSNILSILVFYALLFLILILIIAFSIMASVDYIFSHNMV